MENTAPTVPSFIAKLWTLLDDEENEDLITWDLHGKSFHLLDQARMAKELLPNYFKHNNMSSFIRQLNMYGFKKVSSLEQGSLKVDRDDQEFSHHMFIRGRPDLLHLIKRKVSSRSNSPAPYVEGEVKLRQDDVSRVLADVRAMKAKQDALSGKMNNIQRENEVLWREVASLRNKHSKQQTILSRLVRFLLSFMQKPGLVSSMKRNHLMLKDTVDDVTEAKIARLATRLQEDDHNYVSQRSNEVAKVARGRDVTRAAAPLDASSSQLVEVLSEDGRRLGTIEASQLAAMHDLAGAKAIAEEKAASAPVNNEKSVVPATSISLLHKNASVPAESGKASQSDLSEELADLEQGIEAIKDLLAGGQLNLDQQVLGGLFDPESPLPPDNLLEALVSDQTTSTQHAVTSATPSIGYPGQLELGGFDGLDLVEDQPPDQLLTEDSPDDLVTPVVTPAVTSSMPLLYEAGDLDEID